MSLQTQRILGVSNGLIETELADDHNRRIRTNLACVEQRIHLFRPSAGMDPETFQERVHDYLQAKRQRRRLLKRHPELRQYAGGAA